MSRPLDTGMKNTLFGKVGNGFDKALRWTIFLAGFALLGFLAANAFLFTSVWPPDYLQTILYRNDYLFVTIPAVLLCVTIVAIFVKKSKPSFSSKMWEWGLLGFVAAMSVAFLCIARPLPTDDAALVQQYALQMMEGKYGALEHGFYLAANPQQLGYLLFCEVAYSITGWHHPLLIQLCNVVFLLLVCHALVGVARQLFLDKKTVVLCMVLLAGCLPLMLYTAFAYGTLAGLACATLAVKQTLIFVKSHKKSSALLLVVFSALAVLAKSNYLIFAVGILLFCWLIYEKHANYPAWLPLSPLPFFA